MIRYPARAIAAVAILLIFGIPAASQDTSSQPVLTLPLPTGVALESLFGTALKNSRWREHDIPVCWIAPQPADAKYRTLTRRAVAETWERHGPVRFTGWGECGPERVGIRIAAIDETSAPHAEWIGRWLDGRDPGLVLNFSFANWRPECQQTRDFCVYAIAAHEFGHALGFTHEQGRPDKPDTCQEKPQGSIGDYLVTDYDPASIMNYCNAAWNGDGRLSKLDIMALQKFYGAA